ncbi:hypothetical protein SADUNF_Sadunf05G0088000 [Salix dunnii]|uniref:Uncharacterized protein n=1 Tax=Salix dunnii TaxID=1413687 RepID=A0A835MX80_9ROSI|nr:hypothetical protein SADUNF_Sadunf05G0088000 [Salix dunnii]
MKTIKNLIKMRNHMKKNNDNDNRNNKRVLNSMKTLKTLIKMRNHMMSNNKNKDKKMLKSLWLIATQTKKPSRTQAQASQHFQIAIT